MHAETHQEITRLTTSVEAVQNGLLLTVESGAST